MELDVRLEEAHDMMSKCERAEEKIQVLKVEIMDLNEREQAQFKILEKEERDVEKLEKGSLAALFYTILNKKEDKLYEQECQARKAAVDYDLLRNQLNGKNQELENWKKVKEENINGKSDYLELVGIKAEWIKEHVPESQKEVEKILEKIHNAKRQIRELDEAIFEGKKAKDIAEEASSCLSSAEGWGTWDLMGGGLLTDMMKYSEIDDAQEKVNELQIHLNRFKTELSDVAINQEIRFGIDDFLSFADYIFDGIFIDWQVLDKIHDAQYQMDGVLDKIEDLLEKLENTKEEYATEILLEEKMYQETVERG